MHHGFPHIVLLEDEKVAFFKFYMLHGFFDHEDPAVRIKSGVKPPHSKMGLKRRCGLTASQLEPSRRFISSVTMSVD